MLRYFSATLPSRTVKMSWRILISAPGVFGPLDPSRRMGTLPESTDAVGCILLLNMAAV